MWKIVKRLSPRTPRHSAAAHMFDDFHHFSIIRGFVNRQIVWDGMFVFISFRRCQECVILISEYVCACGIWKWHFTGTQNQTRKSFQSVVIQFVCTIMDRTIISIKLFPANVTHTHIMLGLVERCNYWYEFGVWCDNPHETEWFICQNGKCQKYQPTKSSKHNTAIRTETKHEI